MGTNWGNAAKTRRLLILLIAILFFVSGLLIREDKTIMEFATTLSRSSLPGFGSTTPIDKNLEMEYFADQLGL
ncbi:hypothetical protein M0812_23696 [Anaeramoeba flamelloides]|uniref:Uncharacterized protein n=1 Tax=Anaeramoeba flamelloides TaxID=1746091 RepID=A0AAV7YQG3_9EUKA|nr:hypothetical protein M0812_23696 [Anaeramoeba flamelloides]